MSSTTVLISNDFPPRIGGIENFVRAVCRALDDDVVVLTSDHPGAAAYDAMLPFPVVRRHRVLLPTPATEQAAVRLLRRHSARRIVFGAAAPLGLLAGRLRRAGAEHILGLTHGHETWWAQVPAARHLLHRIGEETDHLSVISGYTRDRIEPALSPAARQRLLRIPPPYDAEVFGPAPDLVDPGAGRPPRCIAVGRLVRRKGFDVLLRAWTLVQQAWDGPHGPELVLVGDGPQRQRLSRQCQELGLAEVVRFAGPQPPSGVAEHLRGANVFAFPVRPRLWGLDTEGLGLAVVEAAACGLPVVVARSGGAVDTVRDQETGLLVEPGDPGSLAAALLALLQDPSRARSMGQAGQHWAAQQFAFTQVRHTVRRALQLP